jgi:cytochrome c oxidase subunit IV
MTSEAGTLEEAHAHPGTSVYITIAIILTVLTAIEVTVFYIGALRPVLVPLLLLLSGAKFALVVMFYMHLRFDRWGYSAIFLCQLFIASAVILALHALFSYYLGSV